MKFVPISISVSAGPFAGEVFGLMLVSVGTGFAGGLMVKTNAFERPLLPEPEKGFWVMTVAVPGLATREAGTVALTVNTFPLASLLGVVASLLPFQVTTVCTTNGLPLAEEDWLTVSVKAGLPALILEGEREVIKAPVLF